MQTQFLLPSLYVHFYNAMAFLIAGRHRKGWSQLKGISFSKVYFDSGSVFGSHFPQTGLTKSGRVSRFLLTQGKPFRQSADTLDWYSHVSSTVATCWSLWCSGQFNFLYNTSCCSFLIPYSELLEHISVAHLLHAFFHCRSLLISHTDPSHFQPKFSLHRDVTMS